MKRILPLALLLCAAAAQAADAPATTAPAPAVPAATAPASAGASKPLYWRVGYSVTTKLQEQAAGQFTPDNLKDFREGMRAAASAEGPALTEEEMQQTLQELQAALAEEAQAAHDKAAAENLAAGKAFLAKNAKRKGVVTLPSGLQYQVLKKGTGPSPKITDIVKADYEGTFIDGKVFDSSRERGEPAEFPLNRVIPGWVEGLQLMSKGAKYKFWLPSELAYGEQGAGDHIGPNSALVFEVELLDFHAPQVEPQDAPEQPAAAQ